MHWTESFILAVKPNFLTAQAYAYEGSDRDPVSDADRQGSEAHRTNRSRPNERSRSCLELAWF